jgi:hypothetical protein
MKTWKQSTLLGLGLAWAVLCVSSVQAGPGYTPVRNVDDGIVNPFATELAWFSGTSGGFVETQSYTVPAGKRLEISEISCDAYAPSSTAVIIRLTVTCGGTTLTHFLTSNWSTNAIYSGYWFMSMNSHHLYVDPGSTVTVDVVRSNPPGASTGYYSDVIISGRMTGL